MTVTNTTTKAVAQGNGATTVWPFTFPIPDANDLEVYTVDVVSGNETLISPVTYTVTGIGDPAGGTVTYPLSGSPLTTATYLLIQRTLPLVQDTSYSNQGAVYPEIIEASLDGLTMMVQQLQETINRSIIFNAVDSVTQELPPASARAGLFLAFDTLGMPIAAAGIDPSVTVSAAMIPVVEASTTAAALTALGIPGSLLDALIPAGTIWDYSLPTPPPGFVFPYGQPCTSSYPVYRAALIAASSPYGSDGTDPLMPDLRSYVVAGKSDMGGTDNSMLAGGSTLGAILGSQNRVLITSNLPPYTPIGTNANSFVTNSGGVQAIAPVIGTGGIGTSSGSGFTSYQTTSFLGLRAVAQVWTGVAQGGTSAPVSVVQPTFILNKIIKVH